MNSSDFRSDRSRCMALARVLEMQVVKQAIQAIFSDMAEREARRIDQHADGSSTVELRLLNQRLGYQGFLNNLETLARPIEAAPPDPVATYGADPEAVERMNQAEGWMPVSDNANPL